VHQVGELGGLMGAGDTINLLGFHAGIGA